MPIVDPAKAEKLNGSSYPEPHAKEMRKRWFQRLGDLAGLTQFGVNLVTLDAGGKSSLRHWHMNEDEFLLVTEGDLVLVEDSGETAMKAGDMAAFKAGVANGHHLLNRSAKPASFLVVGTRSPDDTTTYSDVDLICQTKDNRDWFTKRNGKFVKEA